MQGGRGEQLREAGELKVDREIRKRTEFSLEEEKDRGGSSTGMNETDLGGENLWRLKENK